MTNQHPNTPPPELVEQWRIDYMNRGRAFLGIAKEIAQWGADQELEACIKWVRDTFHCPGHTVWADWLREHRRPKPPSLKEQALAALDDAIMRGDCITISDALPTLRRALEALPND